MAAPLCANSGFRFQDVQTLPAILMHTNANVWCILFIVCPIPFLSSLAELAQEYTTQSLLRLVFVVSGNPGRVTDSHTLSKMNYFRKRPRLHMLACIIGISGSMLVYSILQERIMTEPFGAEGELFKFSLFLVLANRILTFLTVFSILTFRGLDRTPVAPAFSYAAVSLSNVSATTCQYEALKYVSFPLQTLAKCAKMIPVMIWGTLILRKKYNIRDYCVAVAITLGCTLFLTSGQTVQVTSKRVSSSQDSSLWGVLLMAGYLGCDGFTSTFQSKLFKGYKMTIYNQIMYTTLFSAGLSLFGLMSSRQLTGAIEFVRRHPEALLSIFVLAAASTLGQLFIVHTIKAFGPLLFVTVMTLRQFASILLSCIIFSNPLSTGQWWGTAAVFAAVLLKSLSHRPPPTATPKAATKGLRRVNFSEEKIEQGGVAADQKP